MEQAHRTESLSLTGGKAQSTGLDLKMRIAIALARDYGDPMEELESRAIVHDERNDTMAAVFELIRNGVRNVRPRCYRPKKSGKVPGGSQARPCGRVW